MNTITFLGRHINMQTLWGYLVVYSCEFKTRCTRKISEPPTPNNWTYARYSYLREVLRNQTTPFEMRYEHTSLKKSVLFCVFFPITTAFISEAALPPEAALTPRSRGNARRGRPQPSPGPSPAPGEAAGAESRWVPVAGAGWAIFPRGPSPRGSSLSELFPPTTPPSQGGRGSPRLAGAPWRGVVAAALTVPTSEEKAAFSPCFSCARGV